ncbi:G-alpha protein [Cunninghamella echinulata]|nr:G-alpha protein [Cunninghamella echinulata]
MGCCQSAEVIEEKQRNDAINNQIKRDRANLRHEIKLLLLGAGESGKSTILKQMKLIHDGGYVTEERESFKEVIFTNTIQSMKVTLMAMRQLSIEFDNPHNEFNARLIMEIPDQVDIFHQEIVDAIACLWEDRGVKHCVARSNEYQLNDSARYFFDSIARIGHPKYIPSDQDVLRSRVKTTGITETTFVVNNSTYRMFDVGGQRSELAISEYDQMLAEDSKVNRLQEALTLFDSICNSKWFTKTSIILFLNKIDLFAEKLPKNPLSKYFSDYMGGDKYELACQYILQRFISLNAKQAEKQVYSHFTCATDTKQIKFVMAAVSDIVTHNTLRDVGLI